MRSIKAVLWTVTLITLLLQASWLEAAFRAPRMYLRDILGAVPPGLTVTEYSERVTIFGSTSGWNFQIPSHVAKGLRKRCLGPASIVDISADKVIELPAPEAKRRQSPPATPPAAKRRDGCLIGKTSFGPNMGGISLILEGNRLQLRRVI
jgi:hypothetical protein